MSEAAEAAVEAVGEDEDVGLEGEVSQRLRRLFVQREVDVVEVSRGEIPEEMNAFEVIVFTGLWSINAGGIENLNGPSFEEGIGIG
jgi:hypothetical protein